MAHALKGRGIVIIGGTSGMGLSAAKACLAEGAGVVVVGKASDTVETATRELGPQAYAMVGNASLPETADEAIAACVAKFGQLDGLYHVAGGSGRRYGDGPLHRLTDDGWQQTMEMNLTSLFFSNRAAVQRFREQGSGGSVLNMGSVLGVSPAPHYFATHAYAAAKAGAIGLTRSAAALYAPEGIRINLIAPALVETPSSMRATEDEAIQRYIRTKQPLDGGRNGRPEDLDAAVIFFLSDASKFVTGQVLSVDGGWMVSEGQID